ncbi:uncharacterized protein IL334_004436 [Kwoniella shivajii]|uniref:Uncharacterized protein n=1 Tax=Kwoniella shivajii TaxID=564305 RepID=A0ABZ1D0A8_9TREE|nr:hypothetical protein IL334_004436 [Kwoniella shivajii]
MAAVAQAPPILPSASPSGSISRPSSSSATIRLTESKNPNVNANAASSKSDNADKPVAKVIISEATPVEEKGELKKENGDGKSPFYNSPQCSASYLG